MTTNRLRRLSVVLGVTPVVAGLVAAFVVRDAIPDLFPGGIGDGFRKLAVLLGAVMPLTLACWATALVVRFVVALRERRALSFIGRALLIVAILGIASLL